MRVSKILLIITLIATLLMCFSTAVFAANSVTIEDVVLTKYVGSDGVANENLVAVKVTFTAPSSPQQITVLMASEDIEDFTDYTNSKIVYINQVATPANGVYEFVIEKSRIQSATGLEDIEGYSLVLKIGGNEITDIANVTVTFEDPYARNVIIGDVNGDEKISSIDRITLSRYLAKWDGYDDSTVVKEACDVNGDTKVTSMDRIVLSRYLAKWDGYETLPYK